MEWKRRGNNHTISEVMQQLSGLSEKELTNPEPMHTEIEQELKKAADLIVQYIMQRKPIFIVGDYDADGITSSCILYLTIKSLKGRVTVRLPKRESEGYGLKDCQVQEIPKDALLITIDNGIAAVGPIERVISAGHETIVIDHHLPGDTLPKATILADPWLYKNPFPYCGAGLAYKLATHLTRQNKILQCCLSLAAIGTIADVVPLIGDNRYIVKKGLANINKGIAPLGLRAILSETQVGFVDENTVGFKIAPILNAAGRMLDDGAMMVFHCLLENNAVAAQNMATELNRINEERKMAVETAMVKARETITQEDLKEKILILKLDAAEGILGILAGRLTEEYHRAAICLTQTKDPHILKGSGRTYGTLHLKNALDESNAFLLGYGGHPGAAGLSLYDKDLSQFKNVIFHCKAIQEAEMEFSDTVYYDLEIEEKDVLSTVQTVRKYAPFGEGCPAPIFKVKNIQCVAQGSATYQFLGEKHVKLYTKDFVVVGFDLAQKFVALEKPVRVSAIGYLGENSFAGRNGIKNTVQLEALDFEKASAIKTAKSPLAAALQAQFAK